jgi:outer membrane protein assembly factor BamB
MFRSLRLAVLIAIIIALSSLEPAAQKSLAEVAAQSDAGWRISPEKINIRVGDYRPLQVLDDSAQELVGAAWSVDPPELASLEEEEHGRIVVHANAVGTVRVRAVLGRETRVREITIWPDTNPLPEGTTTWGVHPIGREVGDLPAVPTDDGPEIFSLEQTSRGSNYLRADRQDGIQVWAWLMPEKTHDVELVCGDWFGGAVIAADRANAFTLYAVGKDGALRWQYEGAGRRKGLAVSLEHMVHLLSQTAEETVALITGLDELSGVKKYEITLPASSERQANVRRIGSTFTFACTTTSTTNPVPAVLSHVIVSMDHLAYVAFSQADRTLRASECAPGSNVDPARIQMTQDDSITLWQIHDDGTYRKALVEAISSEQLFSAPFTAVTPTGAIIPDGMNGILVSVRAVHRANLGGAPVSADEFVYRVNSAGEVIYKLQLPNYTGPLRDGMVLGEENSAFATRGGVLIAFNALTGKELWRWDSGLPDVEIYMSMAGGSCAVQTPTAVVEVHDGIMVKELIKGIAMPSWQNTYVKHR